MSSHSLGAFNIGNAAYRIDRYAPTAGAASRPVVVILHGIDGMVGESDKEISKLAEQTRDKDYIAFVPHYFGETPSAKAIPLEVLVPQRLGQINSYRPRVAAAVDYALKQPGVDSTRFGIIGLSLGGGLALWFAESPQGAGIRALVDFFGYVSDPAIYTNAGKLPPTLVFHNKGDSVNKGDGIVDVKNSEDLVASLNQNGVPHDAHFYNEPPYPERFNHTFRPGGTADMDSRARTLKWLDTYVKP